MKHFGFSLFFIFCLVGFFLDSARFAHAIEGASGTDEVSELQVKIDANQQQIDAINAEIAALQKELDVIGTKKNTLQSTINTLTLSQKQLAAQIKLTKNKITTANLQIQKLTTSIGDKESSISTDRDAIARQLRTIRDNEEISMITRLISAKSFGNTWKVTDQAIQFNESLARNIDGLRAARATLATNRDQVSKAKASLVSLQSDLTLQKRSVDVSKVAQQQLLLQTKNQESNYQRIIAEKQAAEKSFEDELLSLQGQLNLTVNVNLLPKVGSGVLSWPYSLAFMNGCTKRKSVFGNLFCVTQYFGNTPFSTANSQIYNGHGHNAIDIASSIGTPVYAALAGTILDTGNTDLIRGCYSFGKWVMITHGNGLNTLYSHLSSIDVIKGQWVGTKQLIGLSGMTGYATGPHLHFGVYATQGTEIMTLRQFRGSMKGCADAKMPVATLTAYLNPLSYL